MTNGARQPTQGAPREKGKWFPISEKGGAQGRNRTTDTVIFSHVLYQLSYLGLSGECGSGAYKGG